MTTLEPAAGIVGILAVALHGARILKDDIQRVVDAPKVVKSLEDDLTALCESLESLKDITEVQWEQIEPRISSRSRTALERCGSVCNTMRDELKAWTKRSRDGKLSWRDRAGIGFFKERQVRALAEELQSCKATFTHVISFMTFYSTLRSNVTLQMIQQELDSRRPVLEQATQEGNAQIALVERSLADLRTTDVAQLSPADEDDLEAASIALEEETPALRTHLDIMQELLNLMQAERLERLAQSQQSQGGTVTNNFGQNNRGVQTGTMTGGTINMAPAG